MVIGYFVLNNNVTIYFIIAINLKFTEVDDNMHLEINY